jgi:GntR family transcriptional regulator
VKDLDPSGDRPIYRQIADHLRNEMATGELGPGDRLPSEAQLMGHYGAARVTVRQALQVLQAEGLTVAEHGRGVFVRRRPAVRRLGSDRFARSHRSEGKAAFLAEAEMEGLRPGVDMIEVDEQRPERELAKRLGIRGSERVVVRRRRYLADGRPVQYATSYLRATVARGTAMAEPDTGPGGIYARLEELGHVLERFTEEVQARMPSPEETKLLNLGAGVPVVHLVRTAYDTGGRAVEVCDTVMAADAFVLSYEFPAK